MRVQLVDFPAVKQDYRLTGYVLNKCERVFLYKELTTKVLTVIVFGPEKTTTIGAYQSYLDVVLYQMFGFVGLENNGLCGKPTV